MKYYLVSEEELKELVKESARLAKTIMHPEFYLDNFLKYKSKKPVEVIAEGTVGIDKTENMYYLGELDYKNSMKF